MTASVVPHSADRSSTAEARPFLKWAGGKNRVASIIASLAPPGGFRTYIEPFCGSAAVFFSLAPSHALLADANEDLVLSLRVVRDSPNEVMTQLNRMRNTKTAFDRVRQQDVTKLTDFDRAVRLIYLNKTAFRGLWRVNRKGQFNTPYGKYDRPYYNPATLLGASAALRNVDIRCADFEVILSDARPGDWVYLDPPYVPDRKWGDFTRYTSGQFGPTDQGRLSTALTRLDQSGIRWLLTNSDTSAVRELYSEYRMSRLSTRRDITLKSSDRASTDLVITNYEQPSHAALRAVRKGRN